MAQEILLSEMSLPKTDTSETNISQSELGLPETDTSQTNTSLPEEFTSLIDKYNASRDNVIYLNKFVGVLYLLPLTFFPFFITFTFKIHGISSFTLIYYIRLVFYLAYFGLYIFAQEYYPKLIIITCLIFKQQPPILCKQFPKSLLGKIVYSSLVIFCGFFDYKIVYYFEKSSIFTEKPRNEIFITVLGITFASWFLNSFAIFATILCTNIPIECSPGEILASVCPLSTNERIFLINKKYEQLQKTLTCLDFYILWGFAIFKLGYFLVIIFPFEYLGIPGHSIFYFTRFGLYMLYFFILVFGQIYYCKRMIEETKNISNELTVDVKSFPDTLSTKFNYFVLIIVPELPNFLLYQYIQINYNISKVGYNYCDFTMISLYLASFVLEIFAISYVKVYKKCKIQDCIEDDFDDNMTIQIISQEKPTNTTSPEKKCTICGQFVSKTSGCKRCKRNNSKKKRKDIFKTEKE